MNKNLNGEAWDGIVIDHVLFTFIIAICSWISGFGFFYGIILGLPLGALTVLLTRLALKVGK